MPLDPDFLLSLAPIETEFTFTKRDTILYALGLGADELDFVYEAKLKALPTMAAVMAYPGFFWSDPIYKVNWRRILHGESEIELFAPLPVEGRLRGVTRLGPIYDKGADKGAVVFLTREIFDGETHIATVRSTTFFRGDGGFGGSSEGQPRPHVLPERAPDLTHALSTKPSQALIYRLSGDYNPLHIDPDAARAAGFEKPILHGLCTYGVAGRSVLATLCGNEPSRLRRLAVRFSAPMFPGETIETQIWRGEGGRAWFRALAAERGIVVLNNGYVEFD